MKNAIQEKVFLNRRLSDSVIVSAFKIKEVIKNGIRYPYDEPIVYLATNETHSIDKVRWAKFDPIRGNKKVIETISLPQLMESVYNLLITRYFNHVDDDQEDKNEKEKISKLQIHFMELMTVALADCPRGSTAYYQDITGIDPEPKNHMIRGIEGIQRHEEFKPVFNALREVYMYG